MSDIVTRGMLNPGSWYVMVPAPRSATPGLWNSGFPSDGKYAPQPPSPGIAPGTYTRPFALTLAEALDTSPQRNDVISKQFGSAVVIDPLGVAAMAYPNVSQGDQSWNGTSAVFPASGYLITFNYAGSAWDPWGAMWPVRRATFRQSSTAWQLDAAMAEHYFRGSDELGTDLPPRDDRPARQNWDIVDVGGAKLPLARQWAGNYSWLVTVVPTTNAARNGLARNPEGHTYDVSVVVFHKRVLPPGAASVAASSISGVGEFRKTMSRNERAVKASIISTGLNGGEILLDAMTDNIPGSPFENLKTGQWIMLCGPHPNSTTSEPRFALNWYQVLSIEGRESRLNNQGTDAPPPSATDPERRLIAVRGPQWPWQPATGVANNLCVGILNGAVAVHTKTMRLESPRSSPVKFGSSGSHTTTPNPWDFDT
jgi:hypothetical protein